MYAAVVTTLARFSAPHNTPSVSILEKGSGTVEEGAVGETGARAQAPDGAGSGGR